MSTYEARQQPLQGGWPAVSGGLPARLAIPALLAISVTGCLIPENIQLQSDAGPQYIAAPEFSGVNPSLAINCIDDSNVGSDVSPFQVLVADLEGENNTPLTARWFVNYSVDDQASQYYVIQDPPRSSAGTISYGLMSHTAADLGLAGRPYGVYAIEIVVADAFDDVNGFPIYRTPPPQHYATSYKWVVRYLQGDSACPH